jgi:hypothetical protein
VPVTSVTLPVLPAIVPAARRIVRAILDGAPRAYDAEVIASEMISGVILSPLGGKFTLTLQWPLIMDVLADRWGTFRPGDARRTR